MADFGTVAAWEEGTAASGMILFTAVGTFSRFFCLGDFAEGLRGTLKSRISYKYVHLGTRESEVLNIGGGLTGNTSLSTTGEASSVGTISAGLRLVDGSG